MEKMDKGLTVPNWVLINRPKILQMPPKVSAQFVCPSQKVWDLKKKLSLGVRSYFHIRCCHCLYYKFDYA
jgi:hypothetical protein